MKLHITLFPMMALLAGCIPLRQHELSSGPAYPNTSWADNQPVSVLVGIDMNREKIITNQSYIVAPTGKRYSFRVEADQYPYLVTNQYRKQVVTNAYIYPYDANGSRLQRWPNGIWSFHFVIETNGVARTVDQQWKYWTYYWIPIIGGPLL